MDGDPGEICSDLYRASVPDIRPSWLVFTNVIWEDSDPGVVCSDCGQSRDTQSKCLVCPAWEEDRDRLELSCIEDMVHYFQRVLKGREDKKRKEKERMDRK